MKKPFDLWSPMPSPPRAWPRSRAAGLELIAEDSNFGVALPMDAVGEPVPR